MDYRKTLRVVLWYACFMTVFHTILPILYNGMYHKINPSIFYRYITNNKYTEDIYIYKKAEPILGFVSDLRHNIDGFSEIVNESVANSNRYKAFIFLEEHIDEVLQIANANEIYIKYLEDNGTNIRGLEQFIHKRAHLDDKILGLAFYLTMLLEWCLFLLIVNNRKAFYVISVIVYIIVMALLYSDGLSDFLLLHILNSYGKFNNTKLTYQDMKYLQIYFFDALKESLMTVVIFDTLFQLNQSDKYEKTIKECRYIFQSLNEQIEYLQFSSNSENTYIARLKVSA